MKSHYTAEEAIEILQISLPTLYSYVSRRLIRSEAIGGDQRKRRYHAEDIHQLKERKEGRHQPEKMLENALHFGLPVMESALTLIADGKCYYRGYDVAELATQYSIEQVAALLWTGQLENTPLFKVPPAPFPAVCEAVRPQLAHLTVFEVFQVMLPLMGAADFSAYDTRTENILQTGVKILRWMAALAANTPTPHATMGETLSADEKVAHLLNTALVVSADHELNASSFTARCVASTGSTLYAVIAAGLAALQGHKHGGHTERVEALFREVGERQYAEASLAHRLKRGDSIPGFGHRLYPDGDPRTRILLTALETAYPDSPALRLAKSIGEAGHTLTGSEPTIDFALVALAHTLNLPRGTPLTLFALGRTVGWIGHALEQYQTEKMIRPRAKYVGVSPA